MSKGAMNLQDSFLNQVRRENTEVKVLLVNGTTLSGVVKGFDNFTVILNNRNGQHLIYKHAIAQLVSGRPHHRIHGQDESAGDAIIGEEPTDMPEGTIEDAPVQQAVPPQTNAAPRQKQPAGGREAFNKIDLSGVKLGDKK